MPPAFAHEASFRLDGGADERAPGAAVTVELCGHWEHEGPRRWPHLAAIAARSGDTATLRVAFVAEAGDEAEVRARIARALRRGRLAGAPRPSGWAVLSEGAASPRREDLAFARRHGVR